MITLRYYIKDYTGKDRQVDLNFEQADEYIKIMLNMVKSYDATIADVILTADEFSKFGYKTKLIGSYATDSYLRNKLFGSLIIFNNTTHIRKYEANKDLSVRVKTSVCIRVDRLGEEEKSGTNILIDDKSINISKLSEKYKAMNGIINQDGSLMTMSDKDGNIVIFDLVNDNCMEIIVLIYQK